MARILKNTTQIKELGTKIQQDNIPKMIQLSKLIEHEDNEYLFGENDDEAVKNLAEGIKKDGFNGAILVWDLKNGTYKIFSGHRRKRAMEYLKKEAISCFVYKYPDSETERRRLLLGANIYTRGSIDAAVSHIYIARQIRYLRETLKMEGFSGNYKKRLAEEFGTSESKIQRYESLLNCSERLLKAEDEGIIPMAQASSMSVLSQSDQDKVLDAVLRLNSSGELSRDEIQSLINMVKLDHISPEDTEEFVNEYRRQVKSIKAADLVNDILGGAGADEAAKTAGAEEKSTVEAETIYEKSEEVHTEKKTKKTVYEGMLSDLKRMEERIRKYPIKDREVVKELKARLNAVMKLL